MAVALGTSPTALNGRSTGLLDSRWAFLGMGGLSLGMGGLSSCSLFLSCGVLFFSVFFGMHRHCEESRWHGGGAKN